ncbi:gas vesicle protein GvpG [Haloarchaeobius amylolyticus]|uniref:gas vesicle protein GvpG n=1 Tax=Haloarchaeobius amylolyticus TaxID=1198296 RepID=UPI00226DD995|nr:protein gvpG [Haloarchaeobius amylolyticus]
MLLVDDLLVRPFVSLVGVLHDMALEELYDVDAIRDDIKENQLLYELGQRSTAEYEARREELEAELALAKEAREQLGDRVEVKG